MEKQDVLAKSRQEKKNEGVTYVESIGRRERKFLCGIVSCAEPSPQCVSWPAM